MHKLEKCFYALMKIINYYISVIFDTSGYSMWKKDKNDKWIYYEDIED